MKTIIVNPENQPRRNGTAPAAIKAKKSTTKHTRPELIGNHEALHDLTARCLWKLYALQWDITSPRLYAEALTAMDDIISRAWLELYEANEEESDESPAYTVIRAIRAWIRETRSNGVSYDETTEDADGNTMDRWSQQPAHNNTEAEAMHRFALDEAAEYAIHNTRTHHHRETIREFYRLISEDGVKPREAARRLDITPSANTVLMKAWNEYRK